jgi:hypothetical protein
MAHASTTIHHRSLRSQKPYFRAKECRLSTPWWRVRPRLCPSVLFYGPSKLGFGECEVLCADEGMDGLLERFWAQHETCQVGSTSSPSKTFFTTLRALPMCSGANGLPDPHGPRSARSARNRSRRRSAPQSGFRHQVLRGQIKRCSERSLSKSGGYDPAVPFGAVGRCEHDGTYWRTRESFEIPPQFTEQLVTLARIMRWAHEHAVLP